jgi:prolyl-tRNA editing enzyme YbaK/EbsC (Cys-tRNA(Pro) deacylase)
VFVSEDADGIQPCLVLASGANTVDVALLRAVLSEPHIRRATAQEAHELTGFSIGGIPPFGHRQPIRTVMDPDLGRFETVWAAAGTANAVFPVAPNTLRVLANAVVTSIAPGRIAVDREQPASAPTNA